MGLASLDSLRQVLKEFGLPEPVEWHLLRKSAVKRDEMVRVAFSDLRPVLVRFHDPGFYRHSDIEQQTRLRAHLSAKGIPVPRLHPRSDGSFFCDFASMGEDWAVTVEDWIEGEAPQTMTLRLISNMGETLASMHSAAVDSGAEFGRGTNMSLFTEKEQYVSNAERLRAALSGLGIDRGQQSGLFDAWEPARESLRGLWPALPRGPVHGDFAEYNLLLDQEENIAAVIDFNLAGDDVFVNELIHSCVRLPTSGEEEHDRANLSAFLGAYETVRPLRAEERAALPYLVTVIRPFRWREVSPLLKAAERGDRETIQHGLERLARLAEARRLVVPCR